MTWSFQALLVVSLYAIVVQYIIVQRLLLYSLDMLPAGRQMAPMHLTWEVH